METKKSWISYVWWFLFTACTVFFTMQAARQTVNYWAAGSSPLLQSGLVGLSFVIITVCGLLVFIISRAVAPKAKDGKISKILTEAIYWFLIGGLFAFRFLNSTLSEKGDLSLLKSALIQNGTTGKEILSGVSGMYVDTLSILFSFLGNKEAAVLYFQLILQILTVITLYFAIRLLCGRIAAYTSGILLCCSTAWSNAVSVSTPETVYMFLWSLLLLLMAIFCCITSSHELSKKAQWIIILLIGAACGAVTCLDMLGIPLLLIAIYLLFITGKMQKTLPLWLKTGILLLGFSIGAFFMLFREATIKGNTISNNIQNWYLQYPIKITPAFTVPAEHTIIFAIIMLLACFFAAAFWLDTQTDFSLWTGIMLLLCIICPILGIAGLKHDLWITLIWSILAGLGLQKMIRAGIAAGKTFKVEVERSEGTESEPVEPEKSKHKGTESEKTEQETNNLRAAETEKIEPEKAKSEGKELEKEQSETVKVETKESEEIGPEKIKSENNELRKKEFEKDKHKKMKPEKMKPEKIKSEKIKLERKNSEKKVSSRKDLKPELKKSQPDTTSRYDTSTGIKYIENPLPLPPKPVKKGMDFPYTVSPKKMCYDLEVPDGDDYDLKL